MIMMKNIVLITVLGLSFCPFALSKNSISIEDMQINAKNWRLIKSKLLTKTPVTIIENKSNHDIRFVKNSFKVDSLPPSLEEACLKEAKQWESKTSGNKKLSAHLEENTIKQSFCRLQVVRENMVVDQGFYYVKSGKKFKKIVFSYGGMPEIYDASMSLIEKFYDDMQIRD